MERLLVLRLESTGVAAEAWLNGVPLARKSATSPTLVLPIHEYTLAGSNRLELVIEPPPVLRDRGAPEPSKTPRFGDGRSFASLRLLLPRAGQRAHPEFARTLGQIDWASVQGEVTSMPHAIEQTVELPIGFPRWRWLDVAPVEDPSPLLPAAVTLLQGIAIGLARGDPEPFVQAARLRFEELAEAYQRPLADDVGRFRVQVREQHARAPLMPELPTAATLRLRPLAGGRLHECLDAAGAPALACSRDDGERLAWPLRLAAIEGRLYVLR